MPVGLSPRTTSSIKSGSAAISTKLSKLVNVLLALNTARVGAPISLTIHSLLHPDHRKTVRFKL
jgi:hypothetical protein